MICERCGQKSLAGIGSYFDTSIICIECMEREQAHPDFWHAKAVENEHVARGDFNYPGVGLPPELRGGGDGRT